MCAGQSVAQWVRLSGARAKAEGQRAGREREVRAASRAEETASKGEKITKEKRQKEGEKGKKVLIYSGLVGTSCYRHKVVGSHQGSHAN